MKETLQTSNFDSYDTERDYSHAWLNDISQI